MDILLKLFFCVISGGLSLYTLTKLIPKLKNESLLKHGFTVLYLSAFLFFYKSDHLIHVLAFYTSILMILKYLYGNTTFIGSIAIVFLYVITLMASMVTSNVSLLLFKESVDFRAVYLNLNLLPNVIFIINVLLLIKYYQWVVKTFKKVATANAHFDVRLVVSNVLLLALIIMYQKITFVNMVDFTVQGVILTPKTQNIDGYFTMIYFFITTMSLVLFILVNRIFIVDQNLERYKFKAETDQMTGALSREAGLTLLKTEMQRAVQNKTDLTIGYIDVNDLKTVNDRWGHKEGDRLIRLISDIVLSKLRDFDSVARLGGDEFLVVFTKCNRLQAQRIWRRITDEFLQANAQGDVQFKISASIGISQFNPIKHTNLMAFVHEADEEMYAQKKILKTTKL